ncbi:helix-turn-helix domain-containing protein [Pseudonocardia cypriaca]|uniref:Regulatory LuxR family protein n=1 Tax=Pseudonocardia cypriaca TaxID=882449 RepID=A0A543GHY9_9PSEU|nr:helix-turn-helix transcriptional regulator [Pseudonocardia cypriaca]TQM45654.1 regulatory LuxR family protein [Pseudonocardia cypriaca]
MGGRFRGAEVLAAAERATDAAAVFTRVSARLRHAVPYDAAVWAATDPETGLVTAPMVVEGLGDRERCAEYWESELLDENVLPFRDLAVAQVPAAGLRGVTGDLPARSARYRRLLQPQGVHDELRGVVRAGGRSWAVVSLFRTSGRAFSADEVDLVASLSRPLATRLRRLARPSWPESPPDAPGPGLIIFDQYGAATSINDEAREHLAGLSPGPSIPSALGVRIPICIIGTALQARAIANGRDRGRARTRIRTAEGRWLACHASALTGPGGRPGPIALVIEPASAADLAMIVAEAYELTPRELQVAQEIARGLPTGGIAARLVISPHTVRDHIKAIFEKTAVSSRGELVARLFAERHPRP